MHCEAFDLVGDIPVTSNELSLCLILIKKFLEIFDTKRR